MINELKFDIISKNEAEKIVDLSKKIMYQKMQDAINERIKIGYQESIGPSYVKFILISNIETNKSVFKNAVDDLQKALEHSDICSELTLTSFEIKKDKDAGFMSDSSHKYHNMPVIDCSITRSIHPKVKTLIDEYNINDITTFNIHEFNTFVRNHKMNPIGYYFNLKLNVNLEMIDDIPFDESD